MLENTLTATSRSQLFERLFPGGIPTLWCPSLTHYGRDGGLDGPRIAVHLQHLSPYVKGLLIPGSTGDAWELSDAETRQLVELVLEPAERLKLNLLIGVLKPDADAALKLMREMTRPASLLSPASGTCVCGFTVCPPRGRELSQDEIGRAPASLLEAGLPTAIYQLPQVTQNEISPELVSELASRFENFILFKDTSGADRVVLSGKSLRDVFTVRGAEGDYARWLNTAGGTYRGFLLSTANCFAAEFHQIIANISARRLDEAQAMSARLTATVDAVFQLVAGLPGGNAFANANKAMDHFCAYGPGAAGVTPPRLHTGIRLPIEVIRSTGEILSRNRLVSAKGYLE